MTNTNAIPSKVKRFVLPNKGDLNTPQLLRTGLYLTWGASLLTLIATISGVQGQRSAINTVGKDSVPSIVTARQIKTALVGMDASAVNELLVKPGQNPKAFQEYEDRRKAFSERIVKAADNITYGDEERKPIETIQLAVGDYITKIQRSRDLNERGDANGVLLTYREASQIMDNVILPAADNLDQVNINKLNQTYSDNAGASARSLFGVVVSSLLLLAVLIQIQVFLSNRTRRTLNPMLLAATAIAILFLGNSTRALFSASYNLKVAKEDAFNSVNALRQARVLAYSANADESRYLLDKANAAQHERSFLEKTTKIAQLPVNANFASTVAALQQGQKVGGFTGYLADELNNITFSGEKEAALKTLSTLGTYLDIDKQIRQLEQSGKHQEAIALCTGYDPNQSNWAFEEFKNALQNAIDINEKAFEQAINRASQDVEGVEITASVATVLISLLTLFGLTPRLKEYN